MSKSSFSKKSLSVLTENDHLIVFDKPAGLLVIPTPRRETNTLLTLVNEGYKRENPNGRLYPCHRLDRDTSGAIIFAKSKSYQKIMMELFKKRVIKKIYVALVNGTMKKRAGEFKSKIQHYEHKKYYASKASKPAITRYKVLETGKNFSLVEVYPETGRTNQIRIHFAKAGHPLIGERKYAIAKNYPIKFRRAALHASRLEWKDPEDDQQLIVQSQIPNDMEVFLARNRN